MDKLLSPEIIKKALKISLESLIWIAQNSINDSTRVRAKDTVEEVWDILDNNNP